MLMLLTSCLTLMPALCLQAQAPLALHSYVSDEEEVSGNTPEAEQVWHDARALAQNSAQGASSLICLLFLLTW